MQEEATSGGEGRNGAGDAPRLPLALELDALETLSLAAQQNGLAPVRALVVENRGGETLRDVRVALRADPELVEPWEQAIALLAPGERVALAPLARLSVERLAQARERTRGSWCVEATAEGFASARASRELVLLPFDHWPGERAHPELLAAFVQPNHPAVAHWLREASAILAGWTPGGSLDGYQGGSRERALAQAAAIHEALARAGLAYANPPASFESAGQKVRTPDRVREEGLATCLDLALVAAACLEQAGLNALVLVVEGHAFAGLWLEERTFPDPATWDHAQVVNALDLGRIALFDPTGATARPPLAFDAARAAARARLADPRAFRVALDLARARRGGLSPLPLRAEGTLVQAELADAPAAAPRAPDLALPASPAAPGGGEAPRSRLEGWKRRLLDLTLRNRLLAFRPTRKSVRALGPPLARLEDELAAGARLVLRPRPAELEREGASVASSAELGARELEQGRLAVDLGADELEERLTELWRSAREAEEEGGASGLYLALGFLEWCETPTSERLLRAPLVLVPVVLERVGVGRGFRLARGGDETRFNATLLEKLRAAFGIELAGLDPLPHEPDGSEEDVDVALALQRVRAAVEARPRWRVVEEAWLGLFTFTKFLMWRDLDAQAQALLESPLVRHLVERPGRDFDPQWPALVAELARVDRAAGASALCCPALADGTQLGAVLAAARGKSFVLEGPPGTGKSQTITNLIAQLVADGKTVLFVSEKIAALEVVRGRLERLGLGRACLELHSQRAQKGAVLAALRAAHDAAHEREPASWAREAAELEVERARLDAYSDALHAPRALGRSVLEVVARLCALRGAPRLALGWNDPLAASEAVLAERLGAARELGRAIGVAGEPAGHPLEGVGLEEVGAGTEQRARAALGELQAALAGFEGPLERLRGVVEAEAGATEPALDAREASWDDLAWLGALCASVERAPAPPERAQLAAAVLAPGGGSAGRGSAGSGSAGALERRLASLDAWCAAERARARASAAFQERFEPRLASLDLDALRAAAREARSSWPLARWWRTRALRRAVLGVARAGAALDLAAIEAALEAALASVAAERERATRAAALEPELRALLERSDAERASAVAGVEEVVAWARASGAALRAAAAQSPAMSNQSPAMSNQSPAMSNQSPAMSNQSPAPADGGSTLADGPPPVPAPGGSGPAARAASARTEAEHARGLALLAELVRAGGAGRAAAAEAGAALARVMRARSSVEEALQLDLLAAWSASADERADRGAEERAGGARAARALPRCARRAEACQRALPRLREWAYLRRARRAAVERELAALVAASEAGALEAEQLAPALERGALEGWLEAVRAAEPALRDFFPREHEARVARFRELDARLIELGGALVRARVGARAPRAEGDVPEASELGLLRREMQKKTRHLALRKLFAQAAGPVQALKPCFLMSPISVAQHLPPGGMAFDAVVFDEASQIPTWDAVGVLARGRQAIVVGDSRQLPPTAFFEGAGEEEPADEDAVVDLESILDECRGAGLPALDLRWHYRSRHESLIAFSNRRYYDGRLFTFPAARSAGLGVRHRAVPAGVYHKGGTRTNRAEAEAVVEELLARLRDPARDGQSFGVVTFSQPQQRLVEDLLDQARRADPALEPCFTASKERPEPVFVKNLENVQGDERDVVLFSIGYGPDESGRVAMNFGPLNQQGGERRLNVAITRARRELVVVATLRSEQIDLERTGARGVQDLKAFLAFAERGEGALPPAPLAEGAGAPREAGLEEELAAALRARGHRVRVGLGSSGQRLELALLDPRAPAGEERYLLGLSSEAAGAHAASARDRERLRELVLESLGWSLERVWALEWWERPAAVLARVEAALARAGDPDAQAASEAREDDEHERGEAEARAASPEADARDPGAGDPGAGERPYRAWRPRRALPGQERFYAPESEAAWARALTELVRAEGPLLLAVAVERLARAAGFGRVTAKAQEHVRGLCARAALRVRDERGLAVLWPSELDPAAWRAARAPGAKPEDRRAAEELPPAEIANAAEDLLERGGACPTDGLLQGLKRAFGLASLSRATVEALERGLELLAAEGRAQRSEDGRWRRSGS